MRPGSDEAPALAGARRFKGQTQEVSGHSATDALAHKFLPGGVHMSSAPIRRSFETQGIGVAPAAYLMAVGSREQRRDLQRSLRRLAVKGDAEAADVLATMADLQARASSGDSRASATLARLKSGR